MVRDGFFTNLFDNKKADEFFLAHQMQCDNYTDYTITIRSSGIGSVCHMQCVNCGEWCDISDYENW